MDLEELKNRYKMIPLWQRMLVIIVLALVPAYLNYTDEVTMLEEQLVSLQAEVDSLNAKFEAERVKRQKLPELEAKLNFTEQQLKESSKSLPESFFIDDVLQEVSVIARDVNVTIEEFDPGSPIVGNSDYKYMELPIYISVTGDFQKILTFFDKIVHMKKMIHLKDIQLIPYQLPILENETKEDTIFEKQSSARNLRSLRSFLAINLFKSMTPEEEIKYAPPPPTPEEGENAPVENPPAEGQNPDGQNPPVEGANQARVKKTQKDGAIQL